MMTMKITDDGKFWEAPSKNFKTIVSKRGKIIIPRYPKFITASENKPLFARA